MLHWLRNLSLATKVTLSLSLTATFFMLVLAGATYHFARYELQQTIVTNQNLSVASLANQLDDKLASAQSYLQLLSVHLYERHQSGSEDFQELLVHHDEAYHFFDAGLVVVSAKGRIIAESPHVPHRVGLDRSNREYFRRVMQSGGPIITEPYQLSLPPYQPVVAVAVPIKDHKGQLAGVLVGRYSLLKDGFLQKLIDTPIGKSGYFYLFNQRRQLLVYPVHNRILTVVPSGANVVMDVALAGREGTWVTPNSKQVPSLSSIKRLKTVPWYLAAYYPLQEAYAPLHRAKIAFVGVLLVCVLLVLIAVRVSLLPLIVPLKRLTNHIRELTQHTANERYLQVTSQDELGSLTAAFNDMLQELDDEAVVRNENLEAYKIVSEYTSEIAVWRMLDGSIRFISANCLELTGYSDAEFYADASLLDRLVHPDDQKHWVGHYDNHGTDERHPPFQVRFISRDGSVRWMLHTCHVTCNSNGEITGRRGNFSDISLVVQTQELLHNEKLFIENLINSAATPIFVLDANHKILYWNQAIEQFTGMLATAMKGTDNQRSCFYNSTQSTLADLILDAATDFSAYPHKVVSSKYVAGGMRSEGWVVLNGVQRYIIIDASPIVNASGDVVAAIETLEDITERRNLEESLGRLTQAIEQSSSAIVITGPNGLIEYVNPMFSRFTGYSPEEVVGQNPRILKSGETSQVSYAELWSTVASGKVWRGEFHNKRKDGTLFWEFASISPLFDKSGAINGYLAIKDDITEQKAARELLAKYRNQLEDKHLELEKAFKTIEHAKREWEATLDQLHDIIILTDEKHCIRRCNRMLANIAGQDMAELQGRDWRDLFKQIGFTFVSFDATRGELLHKRSARIYDLDVYPISFTEAEAGFVISLNDTTELRATTQELEKALADLKEAQMQIFQQEKMASIGQLAAGVAHEINNPMGYISSNLGTLDKYVDRLTEFISISDQLAHSCENNTYLTQLQDARQQLKVDRIMEDLHHLIQESLEGAERVRRIVQDLKSFSRVDQAATALIDLNETLDTTINIAWNEIKYVAELHRDFGQIPKITCFPQQLNQVFLNLLVNAAHAMEGQRGVLTVKTRFENDFVEVSFSDTGCGIAEDIQKRIFEPFFTTKEVGKGTGLGLSISYDIIKKHGGAILVNSKPDQGTTFTVRLPVDGVRSGELPT